MTLRKTLNNIRNSKEGFFNISSIYVGIRLKNNLITVCSIYSKNDLFNKDKNLDLNFECLKKNIILKGINFDKPFKIIDTKEKTLIKLF
jgi:hypothetical protein